MGPHPTREQFIAGWIDAAGDAASAAGRLPAHGGPLVLPHVALAAGPGAPRRDGALVLAMCGALHDREQLAAELGAPTSVDDADLLLLGYRRFGSALPEHLRGELAAVVWDEATRTGLAFCDHMAHQTLWWHRRGPRLVLASDARYLLPLLPTTPGPDLGTLAAWLAVEPPAGDRTPFAAVSRLRGGHRILLDARSPEVRPEPYWHPGTHAVLDVDRDEAVERVRDGLRRAVARRSPRAPGSLAIMLSGGLDSSTVAAFAAERDPALVRGYSATFPTFPTADETALIRTLREAFGIDGTELAVRSGSVLAGAVDHVVRWRVPPVSPNLFFWRPLLDAASADGATVLLDGEGGDELFGMAPYYVADLVGRGRLVAAARHVRAGSPGAALPRREVLRILADFGLRGALPHRAHGLRRRGPTPPSWLRPAAATALVEDWDPWRWKLEGGPRWRAHLRAVVRELGGAVTYEHVRRRAADSGLAVRHPLVDPDLVDLVLRLPPRLGFDARHSRPLLREAVRGRTPDAVRLRQGKSNFNGPFYAALRGPDREPLRQLLGPGALVDELVRPERRAELSEGQWPTGTPAERVRAISLYRLATAELWLRDLAGEDLHELEALRLLATPDYSFFHP